MRHGEPGFPVVATPTPPWTSIDSASARPNASGTESPPGHPAPAIRGSAPRQTEIHRRRRQVQDAQSLRADRVAGAHAVAAGVWLSVFGVKPSAPPRRGRQHALRAAGEGLHPRLPLGKCRRRVATRNRSWKRSARDTKVSATSSRTFFQQMRIIVWPGQGGPEPLMSQLASAFASLLTIRDVDCITT